MMKQTLTFSFPPDETGPDLLKVLLAGCVQCLVDSGHALCGDDPGDWPSDGLHRVLEGILLAAGALMQGVRNVGQACMRFYRPVGSHPRLLGILGPPGMQRLHSFSLLQMQKGIWNGCTHEPRCCESQYWDATAVQQRQI